MLYKFHKITTSTFKTEEKFHYVIMKNKSHKTLKLFPSCTSGGQWELVCSPNNISSWVSLSLYLTWSVWRSKVSYLLSRFLSSPRPMAMLLWAWGGAGYGSGSLWYCKNHPVHSQDHKKEGLAFERPTNHTITSQWHNPENQAFNTWGTNF